MKRSSTQMIYWLNSIENWTQLNTNTEWKAQDRHRKKLKKYTFSLIIALDKFHETIINRSIENHEQIKTHIDKMIDFMSTVSLMRICKHLTFIDDESLINVSSTMHIKITVQLSLQYNTVINESMNAHKKAMKRIYESKLTAWKRHNKLDEKSKVKIQEYLARIRILQVLSFFSRLLQLKTMKHLLLINEYSKEQRWIKINSMILYKMIDNLANSFQRHIREICDHNHCFKIVTINKLIEKWDFKKKTMFCSMSSMQAEILYHVSDHVICCAACLATWR